MLAKWIFAFLLYAAGSQGFAATVVLVTAAGDADAKIATIKRTIASLGLTVVESALETARATAAETKAVALILSGRTVIDDQTRAARYRDAGSSTLPEFYYDWSSTHGLQVLAEGLPCHVLVRLGVEQFSSAGELKFTCHANGRIGYLANLPEHAKIILERQLNNEEPKPFFGYVALAGGVLRYFQAETDQDASTQSNLLGELEADFASNGPLVLFLRSVAADYIWDTKVRYANFTIDDPWLHDPYGSFSFAANLESMKATGYHTTIAFIPWNYDRSDKAVAELINANRGSYSLAIHGNNHDHEEFANASASARSEELIKQALSRMQELKRLTNVDHDRVMVFPQRIAPGEALTQLRRYRFDCTANLENHRDGSRAWYFPSSWDYLIDSSEGIPSLRRELPSLTPERLSLLNLLRMPVLIHAHQDYFAEHALTDITRKINSADPAIQWSSLGQVCKNLWMFKKDTDNSYSVMVFGRETVIQNDSNTPRKLSIFKPLAPYLDVGEVRVSGRSSFFWRDDKGVHFDTTVKPHEAVTLNIKFSDEIPGKIAPVSLSSLDLRVAFLRYVSDFRDLVMSRLKIGQTLVSYYYVSMKGQYSKIDYLFALLFIGAALTLAYFACKLRRAPHQARSSQ